MPAPFPLGLAYCGSPPNPAEIWSTWRLDPLLLSLLAAWCIAYAIGCRRLGSVGPDARHRASFYAGWSIVTLALVSPLCPLSVSLFAARATQHVILALLGAPLIIAARPLPTLVAAFAPDAAAHAQHAIENTLTRTPFAAAATFAVCVWVWHMPGPYAATFLSVPLYWCMHVTMFGSACWLWAALLRGSETNPFAGVVAGIASSVQMGLLGALITLSPRALYGPHFLTTATWGLTPLQDQQLGGVVMWVPGCTAFLVVAMVTLARWLSPARRAVRVPVVARTAVRNPLVRNPAS